MGPSRMLIEHHPRHTEAGKIVLSLLHPILGQNVVVFAIMSFIQHYLATEHVGWRWLLLYYKKT